jgi:hypothetical protein
MCWHMRRRKFSCIGGTDGSMFSNSRYEVMDISVSYWQLVSALQRPTHSTLISLHFSSLAYACAIT